MEILIFYDTGVREEHFKESFKALKKSHKIRTIELDRRLSFKVSTDSEKRIREFIGSPRQLEQDIGKADILIVNYAPVTAEVMDADRNLKLIGITRGGPVNVDMVAATERGIPIINAPERNIESVADFTFGLMIAELRQIARAYHLLKTGKEFRVNPRLYPDAISCGFELHDKTLGIIGLGRIGRLVAQRARAFGLKVIYYDPFLTEDEEARINVKRVKLDRLLRESDFVSLHLRLNEKTQRMIGYNELVRMKRTAYIINTSRGGIIDEEALVQILKERKIAGAALDVVEDEPIHLDNPLLKLDNVTITPHMAGNSKDVPFNSASMIAEEVTKFIKGEKLSRLVKMNK